MTSNLMESSKLDNYVAFSLFVMKMKSQAKRFGHVKDFCKIYRLKRAYHDILSVYFFLFCSFKTSFLNYLFGTLILINSLK